MGRVRVGHKQHGGSGGLACGLFEYPTATGLGLRIRGGSHGRQPARSHGAGSSRSSRLRRTVTTGLRLPQCARVDADEAIAHHYLPVTSGTGTHTFLAGNLDDELAIFRGKTLLAALVKENDNFPLLPRRSCFFSRINNRPLIQFQLPSVNRDDKKMIRSQCTYLVTKQGEV